MCKELMAGGMLTAGPGVSILGDHKAIQSDVKKKGMYEHAYAKDQDRLSHIAYGISLLSARAGPATAGRAPGGV